MEIEYKHDISRCIQDTFCDDIMNKLGFTIYGYPKNDDDAPGFKHNEDGWTNGVFTFFPFYWGECKCNWSQDESLEFHDGDCPLDWPNFVYHPQNLKIQWYKYALRGANSNTPLTTEILNEMIAAAKAFADKIQSEAKS